MYDLALKLVVPSFVRDLMLGSIHRLAGRTDAARHVLLGVQVLLTRDRARNAQIPTEPNYLLPLSRELAAIHDDGEAAAGCARG